MTSYEYYNYINLNILSSLKPASIPTGFLGDTSQNLFMIDSADNTKLQKSTDKGDNWTNIVDRTYTIRSIWYDRPNELLYYYIGRTANINNFVYKYDIAGDSESQVGGGAQLNGVGINKVGRDVFIIGSSLYCTNVIASSGHQVVIFKWDGSTTWDINATINLDGANSYSPAVSYVVIVGTDAYFLVQNTATNTYKYLVKFDSAAPSCTNVWQDRVVTYSFPDVIQRGIAYDGNNTLYMVLNRGGDDYLMSFTISITTMTELGAYDIALMPNRFTDSTVSPPFNLERGFHTSEDKVYQIPAVSTGTLNYISNYNFADTIIGITNHFLIDNTGNMYEVTDQISYILNGWIYTSRNYFSYLEMKFNSDNITIVPQMFIQIIAPYTAGGSTTASQVVFEGIAKKPNKGRFQFVLIENQASEMEFISPRGNKSGRTDQIIIDINNDGVPDGTTYITDGTLANGGAMGLLDLSGAKIYRKVLNDFAEHDAFLWNLTPQGALDYNAGGVDSGADIRNDISTYTDTILQVQAWTVAKLNQIIVNGAINPITGEPYTGIWIDDVDQQANGINADTIEDAQLNTDALCQAKADAMGGNEVVRTRVRFKYSKVSYGLIQVGQTITFLYDITNYITIPSAQFILDKIIMNIKTEIGYAEISSGL